MAFSKAFTFSAPDDYLAQTDSLGLTVDWTYEGPPHLFVFVHRETGLWRPSQSCISALRPFTQDEKESAQTRAGRDHLAVEIDVANASVAELCIASILFGKDTGEAGGYPQKEYATADGVVHYKRPDPQGPDHTFAADEIRYDLSAEEWVTPLPWFKPWMTMEQHMAARDGLRADAQANLDAEATENGGQGNLTDEMRAALTAFVAELDGLYDKFSAADGWGPHMIPFPDDPRTDWIDGYDYRVSDIDSLVQAETGMPVVGGLTAASDPADPEE